MPTADAGTGADDDALAVWDTGEADGVLVGLCFSNEDSGSLLNNLALTLRKNGCGKKIVLLRTSWGM